MTSTYLDVGFFFLAVRRPVAGPIKSSMLLALLMLVPGRLPAAPARLVLLALRDKGGKNDGGGANIPDPPPPAPSRGEPVFDTGGGALADGPGWGEPAAGGPGPDDTDRGAVLGGGGTARGVSTTWAPGALLTHRLSLSSYTNVLSSPSLAFIGLLAGAAGDDDSAAVTLAFSPLLLPLLPPPLNQPRPQPRLDVCLPLSSSACRFSGEKS